MASTSNYTASQHVHIDTEQLISEVRVRPALWDCSHYLYKDRSAKLKAWREVYHCIYPKYEDVPDIQKMGVERNIQQRWKTARDAYIRSKNTKNRKTGPGLIKRATYIYSKQLKFLDERHTGHGGEDGNCTDEENRKQDAPSTSQNDTHKNTPPVPKTKLIEPEPQPPNSKRQNRESSSKSTKSSSLSRTTTNFKKKRKRLLNNANDMGHFDVSIMQNDDMAFFYSLLPITQTFDNYQKMLFRSEVLKKAMEVSEYTDLQSTASPMFVLSNNPSPESGFDAVAPETQDEIFYSTQEPICQVKIEFADTNEGLSNSKNT